MYGSSTVGCTVFCFFLRRRYRSSNVAIITTAKIAAADATPILAPGDKLGWSSSGSDIELLVEADVVVDDMVGADMAGVGPEVVGPGVVGSLLVKPGFHRATSEDSKATTT
jgi:hypothetical protein